MRTAQMNEVNESIVVMDTAGYFTLILFFNLGI
jgi:hypothetical protein